MIFETIANIINKVIPDEKIRADVSQALSDNKKTIEIATLNALSKVDESSNRVKEAEANGNVFQRSYRTVANYSILIMWILAMCSQMLGIGSLSEGIMHSIMGLFTISHGGTLAYRTYEKRMKLKDKQ